MSKKYIDIAKKAAIEAGKIQQSYVGQNFQISFKNGSEVDLLTEVDTLCEKKIIEIIGNEFPDHKILAEESGDNSKQSDYCWIIDPLDGTMNYSHGFPFYSVSIALELNKRVIAGAVYHPPLNELFTAQEGRGAFLNGIQIFVSNTSKIELSLLGTGFPYDKKTSKNNNIDNLDRLLKIAQGIRRAGSAAIDLCYVAVGRLDGFWEIKLKPWDTGAGFLIVKEAGGTVTDFKGENFSIYSDQILASNGKFHNQLVSQLKFDNS